MSTILELLGKLDGTLIAVIMGFVGFGIFRSQRRRNQELKDQLEVEKKSREVQGKIHREAAKILDKTDRTESNWEGRVDDANRKGTLNAYIDLFNKLYETKPDQFADGLDPSTYKKPKV